MSYYIKIKKHNTMKHQIKPDFLVNHIFISYHYFILSVCLSLIPLEWAFPVVGGAGLESGSPLVKKSARGIRKSRQTTTRILQTFTFTEIQREMLALFNVITALQILGHQKTQTHLHLLSLPYIAHFFYNNLNEQPFAFFLSPISLSSSFCVGSWVHQ